MAEWIDMTGKGRVTPRLEQVVTAFVSGTSKYNKSHAFRTCEWIRPVQAAKSFRGQFSPISITAEEQDLTSGQQETLRGHTSGQRH